VCLPKTPAPPPSDTTVARRELHLSSPPARAHLIEVCTPRDHDGGKTYLAPKRKATVNVTHDDILPRARSATVAEGPNGLSTTERATSGRTVYLVLEDVRSRVTRTSVRLCAAPPRAAPAAPRHAPLTERDETLHPSGG